jgi:hypothetical protein
MYAPAGTAIASTMSASPISQGRTKSRMKPMMIPAMPHFMCGVMLTPFIASGPGTTWSAQLPLAYVDRDTRELGKMGVP